MRVIVQVVDHSSVSIEGKLISKIDKGYNLLVGFKSDDNQAIIDRMIDKIIKLRIFEDQNKKMNLSIAEVNGSILLVSQFTLYANVKNGNRPSFTHAASSSFALTLYDYMFEKLTSFITVKKGEFGAKMNVLIDNCGPVTIILDSDEN